MWNFSPPVDDMRFVLEKMLDAPADWSAMPRYLDFDAAMIPQILEAAGKFASETLAPLNSSGDIEGCRYEDGAVKTPAGFAEAYRRFCEAGWPSLACDAEHGGQGLPQTLNAALSEMLVASNHAWSLYPSLAHGAYELLRAHASDSIKSVYLPKIVSGEWLTTMCLTEPQAGSDVGLLQTRAEPAAEGNYRITGSKIFISGGEHDMTDNIVHLVLARLPQAPPGSRGISLFLVPKQLDGSARDGMNDVRCDGIERKMGIKGSATCVMSFNGAQGWLIGEPNRGLAAMFIMMNAARLQVGLQGLGHAEMAYQNALRYASERVQMRVAVRPPDAAPRHSNGADAILLHPAIRKVLLTLRAFVEGERALGYWAAHLLDVAEFHPDASRRSHANDVVSLLTPVIKSFFTDNGFALSSAALQVWGGYGYIHDYGIEQTVRDSRIAMIYEGTNEIQAVDLLVRKVIGDGGEKLSLLLGDIDEEAKRCALVANCESYAQALLTSTQAVAEATRRIVGMAKTDPEFGNLVSSDFLRLIGLLLMAYAWARMARVCADSAVDLYRDKCETARFYFDYLLPEARFLLETLNASPRPLPWIKNRGGT